MFIVIIIIYFILFYFILGESYRLIIKIYI